MYKFILVLMFATFIGVGASSAIAQVTTSSGSQSGSSASTDATAISGGGSGQGVGRDLNVSPSMNLNSVGSDLSKSVPLVQAPQMTVLGGEDSCLKSRSGGGAISGFGASFGTMVMDNECNRRVLSKLLMAYQESDLALAVLCGSPQMWAAAERTAKRKGTTSICFNEKPRSADVVSVKLREDLPAGPIDTSYDYEWSLSEEKVPDNSNWWEND